MVDEGYRILAGAGSMAAFGTLMHRAWLQKRSLDHRISNDRVDKIYQAGLDAGALGGKLLGAGGGGFLLFFVAPEDQKSVRHRLRHLQEISLKTNAPGSRIILGASDQEVGPAEKRRVCERGKFSIAAGDHPRRRSGNAAAACPA